MISFDASTVARKAILAMPTLLACALWGCASHAGIFNEAGVPRDRLALVDADGPVQVTNVFDANRRRVLGTDSWTAQSRWTKLELQPGAYVIVAQCTFALSGATAVPRVRVDVEPGKRYLLACEVIPGNGKLWNTVPTRAKLVLKDRT